MTRYLFVSSCGIGIVAGLYYLIYLLATISLFDVEIELESSNVRVKVKEFSAAILLQPSPVRQRDQISRLLAIDKGWADDFHHISVQFVVYAAILRNATHIPKFRYLSVIPLCEKSWKFDSSNCISRSAFENMVISFTWIALHQPNLMWIFFGNDHTYVIASNLYCYLASLDKNDAVYTGSMLKRGRFKDLELIFASGGAGVVMSHVSVKSLFVAWAQAHYPLFAQGFLLLGSTHLACGDHHNDWLCFISTILQQSNNSQISFAISPSRNVSYQWSPGPISVITTGPGTGGTDQRQVNRWEVSSEQARVSCTATSQWSHLNPGLVVAYCLQKLCGVKLLTESLEWQHAEKFHVYGAVRTLTKDQDSWFIECKQNLERNNLTVQSRLHNNKAIVASSWSQFSELARDSISFHYVSQHEQLVLHSLLTRKSVEHLRCTRTTAGSESAICSSNGSLSSLTLAELKTLWPHEAATVGDYSRKIKSDQEAQLLLTFLKNHLIVQDPLNCQHY